MITVPKLGIAVKHNAAALHSMSVWLLLAFTIAMVVLLSIVHGDHSEGITALCGLVTTLAARLISITPAALETPATLPLSPAKP